MQTDAKLCMKNSKYLLDQVTKKWNAETSYLYWSQAIKRIGKKVTKVSINATPAVPETKINQLQGETLGFETPTAVSQNGS